MPETGPVEILKAVAEFRDSKRVPTADGRGVTWVDDGSTAVAYVALLDRRAVYLMAERAYRNKSGKSSAGALTVKIVKREKMGVKHGR